MDSSFVPNIVMEQEHLVTPDKASSPANTPGRPEDSGSRQQTHKNQTVQSGDPEFDQQAAEKSGKRPAGAIPPGPK